MSSKIVIAVLLVAVLAMGAALHWRFDQMAPGMRAGISPAASQRPVEVPASATSSVSQRYPHPGPGPEPARAAPLPSRDIPFHLVVDDLKRRAAKGEAAAGCRLAAEYLHCSQMPERRDAMDRWLGESDKARAFWEANNDTEAAARFDDVMAERQQTLAALAAHCQGVVVPTSAEMVGLWRDSAVAGNPAALKQYASGNAFRWNTLLEALPELTRYRQEAGRMATIAAERGDFDMLLSLAAAYHPQPQGGRSLLTQALQPDEARSLALYRRVESVLADDGSRQKPLGRQVRERIERLEMRLSQAELMRADAIARSELAAWRTPVVRGVDRLDVEGRQRDIDRGWCER